MNLIGIKNATLRRTALVLAVMPCAVLGIFIVLYQAAVEYVDAWRSVPEDFRRIWRGEI